MSKETSNRLATTEELKELKKKFRDEFRTHPCFMGFGVGAPFHGETLDPTYLRIYLKRLPQTDKELNDFVNLIRGLPPEASTSIKVEDIIIHYPAKLDL